MTRRYLRFASAAAQISLNAASPSFLSGRNDFVDFASFAKPISRFNKNAQVRR
jgi:hypothetical protein